MMMLVPFSFVPYVNRTALEDENQNNSKTYEFQDANEHKITPFFYSSLKCLIIVGRNFKNL